MSHSSPPPSRNAGTKQNSGARFRVISIATSERRRGASRRSALIASVTRQPAGMTTCTSSRPQSGAGHTSSTNNPSTPSPALRFSRARFNARCTCGQNCCVFRCDCRSEDRRLDSPSYRPSAKSGSMDCDSLLRRLCCFKTKLPYRARTRTLPARTRVRIGHHLVS